MGLSFHDLRTHYSTKLIITKLIVPDWYFLLIVVSTERIVRSCLFNAIYKTTSEHMLLKYPLSCDTHFIGISK